MPASYEMFDQTYGTGGNQFDHTVPLTYENVGQKIQQCCQ